MNYTNNLTVWILVFIVPATLLNSITFYFESSDAYKIPKIIDTVHVGSRPHSIEFALGKVYVTNSGSDSVSVIDSKTDKVISTIPVGADPHGIAAINNVYEHGNHDPDSNHLSQFSYVYVANTDSNTVSVIDCNTDRVISTIPVEDNPVGIITSNTSDKVYVTNRGSDSVSIIDGKTNEVIESISVGSTPEGLSQIIQDETNNRTAATLIYVVNTASNSISSIDGNTNKVIATIHVGKEPHGIIANDIAAQVYIANSGSDSVSIIDANTNKAIATIPVGNDPHRLDLYHGIRIRN